MIKIMVGAKRVVDANVKVRVKSDYSDVDIEHSKMSLNPFDENAIEEAVKLKQQGIVSEIVAVSVGSDRCSDTLRTALARGCDRAILVNVGNNKAEPIMVAKIFKQLVAIENPDIVFLGKQAIDDDANQVGQMLAGMLNYPQGTFVSHLNIVDNKAIIDREIENGTQTLEITIPAVLTADLHLNEPRFIKLPDLMMAKKKPIHTITLEELNIKFKPSTRLIKAIDGEIKKQCMMLNNLDELISTIRESI